MTGAILAATAEPQVCYIHVTRLRNTIEPRIVARALLPLLSLCLAPVVFAVALDLVHGPPHAALSILLCFKT